MSANIVMDCKVTCWLCNKFSYSTLKGVLRHMASVHAYGPNFHIVCGIEGCCANYTNYFSFKKHVYRKHRVFLDTAIPNPSGNVSETVSSLSESDGQFKTTTDSQHPPNSILDEKKCVAQFVMKSRAVYKTTEVHLTSIMNDFSVLLDRKLAYVKDKVMSTILEHCLPTSGCAEVERIFESPSLRQPFAGFETRHLQDKFMMENMGFVLPEEIKIKQKLKRVRKKSSTTFKLVWDYSYYIPLLSSLKSFLNKPGVLEEVLAGHRRTDGLYGDYCDSSSCTDHPLFSRSPCSLMLFIYYDDAEVCNPLGSRAKKHKLALFYYSIGNIHPSNRSSLDSIQLLAVTKSTHLQDYGPDHILEPIMKDIKVLESDGLTLSLDGEEHTFQGTIVMVPGDNLASQYLGGYKALNAALRKCRHCLAIDEDMKTKFDAEEFPPRTRETHRYHCSAVMGPAGLRNATTFGIRFDSLLNSSKYFHVTEGLVPDIMHDVLEGSLSYEIKELLRWLISERVLTLNELNDAISSFPFWGEDARNKPCLFDKKLLKEKHHGLKQTATQVWCFARLLPLIIGEKIPAEDDHWENFLLHLRIVDYIFAPVISMEMVAYLREMIRDHHRAFTELYPTMPVTPKMHYMIHYPQWMRKYGPLVRYWVMRFEAKHNFFKDLAHRMKNFRNISKSMVERHQLYSCFLSRSPIEKKTTSGPITTKMLEDVPYREELKGVHSIAEPELIQTTSWVKQSGTEYKPGGVVVLHVDNIPIFGDIIDIVIFDVDVFYLVCEEYNTECFNSHFHAYEVYKHETPQYYVCRVNQLYDYYCLSKYELSSHSSVRFITLKYYLVDKH